MSNDKKSPLEWALLIISIVSAIAFLAKILKKDDEEEREEVATRSRNKVYAGTPPSRQDFIYKDWADSLDEALLMNATEDEDAVYAIFEQMKNISDVNKTIEAFGTRRIILTTQYLTLPQAISTTFNKSEKKRLNDILASKGIEYTFN